MLHRFLLVLLGSRLRCRAVSTSLHEQSEVLPIRHSPGRDSSALCGYLIQQATRLSGFMQTLTERSALESRT